LSESERLELVRWLIDNYDERKASVASRAAILLSADTLLLAAVTFMAERLWSSSGPRAQGEWFLLGFGSIFLVAGMILLFSSIAVGTSGMANVWRTHRQNRLTGSTSRLYFYPRQTFETFSGMGGFDEYVRAFRGEIDLPSGEVLDLEREALGQLWVITAEYQSRYRKLRSAIRLFVYGIIPIMLLLVVLLVGSI